MHNGEKRFPGGTSESSTAFAFQIEWRNLKYTLVCILYFFAFLDKRRTSKNVYEKNKTGYEKYIYFLYVDTWFDVPKCVIYFEKCKFKTLFVFSPSFLVHIKIILSLISEPL